MIDLLNDFEIQHQFDKLIEFLLETIDEMSNFGAEILSLINIWNPPTPKVSDLSLWLPPQLRRFNSFVQMFPDSIYGDPQKFI